MELTWLLHWRQLGSPEQLGWRKEKIRQKNILNQYNDNMIVDTTGLEFLKGSLTGKNVPTNSNYFSKKTH